MTSSPAPAQPRVRVIALGDEMLAGAGDQRAMGWFTRALAQHNGSGDLVDSYTAAIPGETTAELARRWEADVTRLLDTHNTGESDDTQHRVVIALGRADLDAGISIARSRLNLATVLDGLGHLRIPVFVVGPAPSKDRERTDAILELSHAFHDVCARRRIPYVDPAAALAHHDQFLADVARSPRDLPSQTGYGLITWLVLHGEFSEFLATQ
ncbi:GDSL-type esterase/lipase family protein [Dermabacter hominis]|uniref:GDSL-type esterase/lipase family protein n=1 Tax=Dermabacter hominis TaxID=36740 RepID=UPI00223BC159|nr:GDSL-type esterase/lipase family protein [Dermabacter hominis]MCT2025222.1 GDSL-type esterase/lipase family protein [Dermabacter hominis]